MRADASHRYYVSTRFCGLALRRRAENTRRTRGTSVITGSPIAALVILELGTVSAAFCHAAYESRTTCQCTILQLVKDGRRQSLKIESVLVAAAPLFLEPTLTLVVPRTWNVRMGPSSNYGRGVGF